MTKMVYLGNAYTMINETLTFGEVVSVDYKDYIVIANFKTANGEMIPLAKGTKFYESENDFYNGNHINRGNHSLFEYIEEKDNQFGANAYWVKRWLMENGEPKEIETFIESAHLTKNQSEVILYGGINFKDTWASREECLDNNEYDVTDENGNKHHRVGFVKRTMITDEQRQMIEEFEQMARKMKEIGIGIIADRYREKTFFINTNAFKDWGCYDSYNNWGDHTYHEEEKKPEILESDCIFSECYWGDEQELCFTLKNEE